MGQLKMHEVVSSIMDLGRKPVSSGRQQKNGESFASLMETYNPGNEDYAKTSGDRKAFSFPKGKSDPNMPGSEENESAEGAEGSETANQDYAIVTGLFSQVRFPETNHCAVDASTSLPIAGEADAASEPVSVLAVPVGVAASVVTYDESGSVVRPEIEEGFQNMVFLQPAEASPEDILERPGMKGVSGIFYEEPVPAAYTQHSAPVPDETGLLENAVKVHGELNGEKAKSSLAQSESGRECSLPSEMLSPRARMESEVKVNSEAVEHTSKTSKSPVFAGHSGCDANDGFGNAGNSGQLGVGMHVISANEHPAKAQEAFIGRLARVLQNQMLSKSELLTRDGVAEIKLELKPEYLGRLFVRLSLENGAVNARFVVENQQVRNLIENNITQLKQCLADQGVNWQETSVDLGGSGSNSYYEDKDPGPRRWNSYDNVPEDDRGLPDYLPLAARRFGEPSISYLA